MTNPKTGDPSRLPHWLRSLYDAHMRQGRAHPTRYRLILAGEFAIGAALGVALLVTAPPAGTAPAAIPGFWRAMGSGAFALGSVGVAIIAVSFAVDAGRILRR